ncbi:MAG: isoprenyl transferase [Thermodesulfobacteriota bacterium]
MSSSQHPSTDWPRHVAIIMDGNGRWATRRRLPRLEGHRRGAKAVRRAVEFCRSHGIEVLTLYAFSSENWQRPAKEVSGLMRLLSSYVDSEAEELLGNDIRFRTIGRVERLPAALLAKVESLKERTRSNSSMVLNLALSYGGREELLAAAVQMAKLLRDGTVTEDELDETRFSSFLDTAGLPDPDLLIRTGGELRVSNFLLWQMAYTEFYFTPLLWPDFDEHAFMEAVEAYRSRQRRFGMTSEQIEGTEK